MMSMSAVRSLPLTRQCAVAVGSAGRELWSVITPSMMTLAIAVDGDHDDHAHQRDADPAGEQEQWSAAASCC